MARSLVFAPFSRPSVPGDRSLVQNPIDRFVLARLRSGGLSRSEGGSADVDSPPIFDLTGLPPRPEDVEAFLNDEASDAYE